MRITHIALSVVTTFLAFCTDASADAVVARHMGDFFRSYLGRDLTTSELKAVTEEFVSISRREGKNLTAIHERARGFDRHTRLLRQGKDGPAVHTARDMVIQANFFRPIMQNTIELRLFLQPDPVRVVDTRSQRIMTERDVIALVNIYRFAKSSGGPVHRDLSRQEIERAVADLTRAVGGASGKMPRFFTEASTFWIGVRQEWPTLSTSEQTLVRAYTTRTWRIKLPRELFARLWGLDSAAAARRSMDDRTELGMAVMEWQAESEYMPDLIQRFAR
jgi:hypothetical protein